MSNQTHCILNIVFDIPKEEYRNSYHNLDQENNNLSPEKTDFEKMYDTVSNRDKYTKLCRYNCEFTNGDKVNLDLERTYCWMKNEDSGFDLFVPKDITFKLGETILVDFGVKCEMLEGNFQEDFCVDRANCKELNYSDQVSFNYNDYKNDSNWVSFKNQFDNFENIAYYLYARSSIYKYDLIMVNNVGIIDKGYRGNIKACIKWVGNHETNNPAHPNYSETFTLKKGTRICQICHPSLKPFNTIRVNKLSESKRGEGGHGSTGN